MPCVTNEPPSRARIIEIREECYAWDIEVPDVAGWSEAQTGSTSAHATGHDARSRATWGGVRT